MRNTAPKDAAEIEALETREWLESLDYVLQSGGPARVSRLLAALSVHARRNGVTQPFTANTPYVNTIPPADQPPFPGQPRDRAADQEPGAMERPRHGRQGQQARGRHRRSHFDLCVGGHAVRSRIQPLLQGQGRRSRRRHHLLPGPRGARHLRARVSRRPSLGREAGQLPSRAEGRRRPLVVSASVADAGLLGVSHRVDGTWSHQVDLPGALHALPRGSRTQEAIELEGVGLPRRRRDRRTRIARRHHARLAREARQPDLRHQLQPAAPRWSRSRQRADHPGARGRLPRRRLERDQGDLGQRVGRAAREGSRRTAGQAHGRGRRRRVSEVRRRIGRIRAEALLGRRSEAARDGQAPVGRAAQEADPWRSRSHQGLRGLQGRLRNNRTAHGDSGPDHQGIRDRRSG